MYDLLIQNKNIEFYKIFTECQGEATARYLGQQRRWPREPIQRAGAEIRSLARSTTVAGEK